MYIVYYIRLCYHYIRLSYDYYYHRIISIPLLPAGLSAGRVVYHIV